MSRIFPLLHLGNSSCPPPTRKWASTHQNKYPGGLHLAWVVLNTDLWFIFFHAPNPITHSFAYCLLMIHYLIVNKCSNLKYATRLHTANFNPCKMFPTLGAFFKQFICTLGVRTGDQIIFLWVFIRPVPCIFLPCYFSFRTIFEMRIQNFNNRS